MFNWLNFFNFFFFFLMFGFAFNTYNFFFLIILTELIWIVIFILFSLISTILDSSLLLTMCFYILGFASVELSIGLMILVYLKQTNIDTNYFETRVDSLNFYSQNFLKHKFYKKK